MSHMSNKKCKNAKKFRLRPTSQYKGSVNKMARMRRNGKGSSKPISLRFTPSKSEVPWCNTQPLANNNSELKSFTILNPGWWILRIMVLPLVSAMTLSMSIICKAEVLSSPEVGSSRMSTFGSCMTSTPMETLRLSPPDMPRTLSSPILVPATWSTRISSSVDLPAPLGPTIARISHGLAWKHTFFSTCLTPLQISSAFASSSGSLPSCSVSSCADLLKILKGCSDLCLRTVKQCVAPRDSFNCNDTQLLELCI
ncbi:hypothetical protein CR513_06082, partial [Mucuna pruriens]